MSTKALRGSSAKRRFWQAHIADWQSSGLSQRLYCQQHGLAIQSFSYWHRKLKHEKEGRPRFFPIAVTTQTPPEPIEQGSADLELNICESRFSVKIGRNFDADTLRKLILSLEAMSCSDLARR